LRRAGKRSATTRVTCCCRALRDPDDPNSTHLHPVVAASWHVMTLVEGLLDGIVRLDQRTAVMVSGTLGRN
jgi:hypothetical protein